jgi:hypothetical protein
MAHFAEIDENNIVQRVVVISSAEVFDTENEEEVEQLGIDFCKTLYGEETEWVQTSYNSKFRYKFAGIGDFYDRDVGAFIPPKPFDSWVLNTETYDWNPPVPIPNEELPYFWNESTNSWELPAKP